MNCIYINLDKATERRVAIESNFTENNSDWNLIRFSAIDVKYVVENDIKGKLKDAEKGCFLSHKMVIKEHINSHDPILIMEDDVVIGKKTSEIISKFLEVIDAEDWDVIFTDVCVTQPAKMIELISLKKSLSGKNEFKLLNLENFIFAGSASYIINPKSIGKIYKYLDAHDTINIPYDLYVRMLIREKKIKGAVIFPFVTTISKEADDSQIQESSISNADMVWNVFRRAIWMDANLESEKSVLKRISSEICDDETSQFGVIIAACLSKKFVFK
jgi:GR25 family glycosyltransferase involved in LPS biosynthesis